MTNSPRAMPAVAQAFDRSPGGINFEFYRSVERPDHFILHEEWENEAALDGHRQLMQQQGVDVSHLRKGTGHREYVSII